MIHSEELYNKALYLATESHKGQKRWNGDDYITHPIRVADSLDGWGLKVIAIMHDVLEDTDLRPETLLAEGFDKMIVEALVTLTKIAGEDYFDFIMRCKQNKMATIVKIADIDDNLIGSKPGSLRDKYLLAKYILKDINV